MNNLLWTGEKVRLVMDNPEVMAEAYAHWTRDSEYFRLLDSSAAQLWSVNKFKEWLKKDLEKPVQTEIFFSIRALDDDRLLGFIGLGGIQWSQGDAWVAIGIGERQDWGMGYGTDAMRLILDYAFRELNLHRVSLDVFSYNPRAIRSYEKAGFKVEGRVKNTLLREGQRYDEVFMGILRSEWEAALNQTSE